MCYLRRLRAKTLISHLTILELQYANDNAIMTHTKEDLQAAMDAFSQAYNALGLTLNVRKTKVLFQPSPDSIYDQHQPEITAGGQCLSSVDHFSYLGSCLSSIADLEAEIQARLNLASGTFGRLRKGLQSHNFAFLVIHVWLRSVDYLQSPSQKPGELSSAMSPSYTQH